VGSPFYACAGFVKIELLKWVTCMLFIGMTTLWFV